MRHRKTGFHLNRPASQRKALIRNLLTSLFLNGKLQTTEIKAKALTLEADKLISLVKSKDNMNAIRELNKVIFTKDASKKALVYISQQKRSSGFTRLARVGIRAGDCAPLMQVELINAK